MPFSFRSFEADLTKNEIYASFANIDNDKAEFGAGFNSQAIIILTHWDSTFKIPLHPYFSASVSLVYRVADRGTTPIPTVGYGDQFSRDYRPCVALICCCMLDG